MNKPAGWCPRCDGDWPGPRASGPCPQCGCDPPNTYQEIADAAQLSPMTVHNTIHGRKYR